MPVAKGTLNAMWKALSYIEEYGPEIPCEFSEAEKDDGEAYAAYMDLKAAYKKEKRRAEKAAFMAARRKARRRN